MTTITGTDLRPELGVVDRGPTAPVSTPSWGPLLAKVRRSLAALGWAALGVAILLAMWAYTASAVDGFPTIAEGLSELRAMLNEPFHDGGPDDKGIGLHLLASLGRVAWGFGLAVIIGVPLGLAMGVSRRVWQTVNPVIQFLRPVSPLAWFPIWLVILKDVTFAAKWVIFITAVWPIVLNTAAGSSTVPKAERDVAKVFHFKRRTYLRQVLVPNSLPSIVTGMRLSMGVAWMVIVAAEMLSSKGAGIGGYIWNVAYNGGSYPKLIGSIIIIGGVGLVLDLFFLRLGRAVAIETGEAH